MTRVLLIGDEAAVFCAHGPKKLGLSLIMFRRYRKMLRNFPHYGCDGNHGNWLHTRMEVLWWETMGTRSHSALLHCYRA